MQFDIIPVTEAELKNYSDVQMQLLRTAQKNKNKLARKLEQDLELFKKLLLTDGMNNSSLFEQKRAELEADFEYEREILVEQLLYSLEVNSPYPDGGADESHGYIVDLNLAYTERYIIVRDYYLSIRDPAERMMLYQRDDTARRYLGSYYSTLYDVLYTYSQ